MTDVCEEEPYVAVVYNELLQSVCSSCFKEHDMDTSRPTRCSKCKKVYYCGADCQKKDWRIHSTECKFLSAVEEAPRPVTRMIARLLIRRKKGDQSEFKAFNGRTFDDLMDHFDKISKERRFQQDFSQMYGELAKYVGSAYLLEGEELFHYYGKLKINQYDIPGEASLFLGEGLYIGISALDHSCAPDLSPRFIGSKYILRSQVEGQTYNDKLTLSYISILPTTKDRKKRLQANYFFDCQCKRCMDKEEDAFARSVKCSCEDGICPVYDDATTLSCTHCHAPGIVSLDEANHLNAMLSIDADLAHHDVEPTDIAGLTSLYEEKAKVLSRRNTQLAFIAYRLLIHHKDLREATLAAKYARLCEEALIAKTTPGNADLTNLLKNLAEASSLEDPRSANTRRLCDMLRQAVVAARGPIGQAKEKRDTATMRYYHLIFCLEERMKVDL